MKIEIPKELETFFSSYKAKYNKKSTSYSSEIDPPIIGNLHWTVPDEVLWLYSTNNDEGYEGNQTQIGIKKDGTIVWGYFSHCSCYGYEDYSGEFKDLTDDNIIHSQKYFEMNGVSIGVLDLIKQRLNEIVKEGLKDA